jgi:hypothetical protein
MPAIEKAVPDADPEEIANALDWEAKQLRAEADELKRFIEQRRK